MIKEEAVLFIVIAFAGFLVCRLPFIGGFFRSINTFFHEGGHAIVAWIVGSEVLRINLFYDTSGATITQSDSKKDQILISIAGYVFASFLPFLFLLLISNGLLIALHFIIVCLSIIILFLAVRNAYGVLWMLMVLAGYISILVFMPNYSWVIIYTYTGILLFEGLFSSITIFSLSITQTSNAGDAANLSKFTRLPIWFWGLFFMLQAILFFYFSIRIVF